jgi:hypothetical protein
MEHLRNSWKSSKEMTWVTKCTLEETLFMLPQESFLRLLRGG